MINFHLDNVDDLLPPYMPGGEKWKIEVRFFKDNEMLGGYNFFLIIRSEKSLLGN